MSNAETQVSSLPMPPERYISNYTDENIRRNRAPRPPPPPSQHEVYSMFGIQYNNDEMIRSLESQNIKRLIPIHFDRRKELKKLNHSLLVNFLDLIDFLILNPDSPRRTEKVCNCNNTKVNKQPCIAIFWQIDDLSLLFVNMHHLLNEFRPHQARETLRVMMEMQKRQRVETASRFQKHLERVRDVVNTAFSALPILFDDDEHGGAKVKMEVDPLESNAAAKNDPNYQLDRIMCKLVDAID